ncbi:2449_t:CDS:2 [Entrophospora sp. SA101]|nr:2449_t:CDS:2 [Entrophospora sp. SA101]
MPKIRHSRTKKPPQGFEDIEPVLLEFAQKMKDAENEPHEGKRRVESLWPIFRLHHQRSRYIYDLYYKREAISKEIYDYCLKNGYADGNLIAKWKKKDQKSKQKRLQEEQEGEEVEGEGVEEQHQRQLNQYMAAQQETYGESSSQSTLAFYEHLEESANKCNAFKLS